VRPAAIAIAAVLAGALAGPAAAQPIEAQQFGVPGHGNLLLAVPKEWRVVNQGSADPPVVIVRMHPPTGDAFYLQLTAVWLQPEMLATMTDEMIKTRVQQSAGRMLPRAVETEASLVELRGKDALGYYFALTDRNSKNAGTEYKYVVQGTIRTGELVTVFTLLHREPAPAEKEQMLRMIADAGFAKGAATANTPRPDALQVAALDTGYELSVPVSRLVMTIPKAGLTRATNAFGGAADNPRYFNFTDSGRGLTLSGWFEPEQKFHGVQAFWESETRAWKERGLPAPRNVAFAKYGNWDTVLYEHDLPGSSAGSSNAHIRAHWVQSGTWIDVHLSLTSQRPAAEARDALQAFLESLQVKEKP
jgi:hypothetical protein